MPKVQNPKLFEIALQVGGSHYPEVNAVQLEQYGIAIIKQCAEIAQTAEPYQASDLILKAFGVTND